MNIFKKVLCFIAVLTFAFGFSACGGNGNETTTKAAVEFPFEELNEIYDSGKDSKSERFDKKNEGKRFFVDSATVKRVSFKSSVEYDVFCCAESGGRTINFRLFVDLSSGEVTREYIDSLKEGDVISFEGTFLSQTPSRSNLTTFNNIRFITAE